MVHGNPSWSLLFRGLIAGLRGEHRVIAPDHVGCGLSDKPDQARYPYTLRRRVADLGALIDRLDLGGLTLVVHDWGGMIGLAAALERPARIARLVILNTAAFLMPAGKRLPWTLWFTKHVPVLPALLVQGLNAFARGMRSVNPKAEVKVVWVNSWYDPGREREAADTLISQGADVVTHHTDSTAAVQAAEAKKVYAVAYHSDMSKYGPNAHLTAVTHNWGEYYTRTAQAALDGKWKSESPWMGIKEGVIRMAPFSKAVPQDVQDLVRRTEAGIRAGTFHPFTGPVKDNAGKERIAAGRTIDDATLNKMDYYVEGVQGKLP
ncbi:MAG: alpha/beta fold hydrolase, partial [Phycisphaerae bacterium]|nr:alpha/beta fold hydrolase [Phycisphaerae bacterium]